MCKAEEQRELNDFWRVRHYLSRMIWLLVHPLLPLSPQ
jgi:hypothetical protein